MLLWLLCCGRCGSWVADTAGLAGRQQGGGALLFLGVPGGDVTGAPSVIGSAQEIADI